MSVDAGNELFDLVQESIVVHDQAGRIEAALHETGRWESDLARVTAADETVVVRTKWHLRRDARGAPAGIVETGVDVTAQRRETIEQRYRSLFHFVPVRLIQLDRTELADVFETLKTQGVCDFARYIEERPDFTAFAMNSIRIREVNRRTVELFGAAHAGEMLGPVARLWTESPENFRQSMLARYRGAARYEAEIRIRTFDGRMLDVLYVTDFPEALKYEPLGLACLVDVTDRVKAQTTLAQVQADSAHAARVSMLEELTASIAHEVGQPLGAILMNAETALRWLGRTQPDLDELRGLSRRTIGDARRAADIVDRIRAMAMRHEVQQERLALNGVVQDVLMFLGQELRRQSVATVLELASDLPDILADRVQLQQVIANIAINAVQAMDGRDGRRLTIRTMRHDPGGTRVEIADTGPGIAAEQFPHLFQSFFTTKRGGMGIGLAMCRSIIEAHGGAIETGNLPGAARAFASHCPRKHTEG